jgi:hypothetical protein
VTEEIGEEPWSARGAKEMWVSTYDKFSSKSDGDVSAEVVEKGSGIAKLISTSFGYNHL